MFNFYPGPAKIYAQLGEYAREAIETGIIAYNHRSPQFVAFSKKAIVGFKEKLQIPDNYTIFFGSSATECWEIIAQSLVKKQSTHIYNGAFGKKWADYTQKLGIKTQKLSFDIQKEPVVEAFLSQISPDSELIALTQNETSNGTQIPLSLIANLRQSNPEKLIAVDATSSLGGIYIDFQQIDIGYASVQKCLGMPAGMAILICSPRAVKRAIGLNQNQHYNSLVFMIEKMQDWQTTYTPNILNIYLLSRLVEDLSGIQEISRQIKQRASELYHFFQQETQWTPLVQSKSIRSDTVLVLEGNAQEIKELLCAAEAENLILGKGYGDWKKNTFRIANFPAINSEEIRYLREFFTKVSK